MANLISKKCVPCEIGTSPLTEAEYKPLLESLELEWQVIDDKKIKHLFKFKDFKEAMIFVNKIADIAESEGHHPDIYIYYNKVTIELTTHASQGLSENDFILAAKIETI